MISWAMDARAAVAVSGSSSSHPTSICTLRGSNEFVTKDPIHRTSDTGRPRDGRSTLMRIGHRLILVGVRGAQLFDHPQQHRTGYVVVLVHRRQPFGH